MRNRGAIIFQISCLALGLGVGLVLGSTVLSALWGDAQEKVIILKPKEKPLPSILGGDAEEKVITLTPQEKPLPPARPGQLVTPIVLPDGTLMFNTLLDLYWYGVENYNTIRQLFGKKVRVAGFTPHTGRVAFLVETQELAMKDAYRGYAIVQCSPAMAMPGLLQGAKITIEGVFSTVSPKIVTLKNCVAI